MMLKALPLVHFWNVLLLKEQMMTSLRKICLANNHKIGRFLPIAFWWSLPPNSRKITAKSVNFSLNFVPKNPAKNGTFSSVTYQKPLQIHIWNPWLPDLLCKHWFVSSAWNFCHWVADVPLHETSQRWRARRNRCFRRLKLIVWLTTTTTISLMKNTPLWWLWNFKILWGSPVPDPTKKKGVTFRVKVCVCFTIAPVTINLNINHNYNKILKSDWLSTVLISALIGQCDGRVRIMP